MNRAVVLLMAALLAYVAWVDGFNTGRHRACCETNEGD